MLSLLILLTVAAYMAVLFVVAGRSDRPDRSGPSRFGGWTYALSLAIYCTSWTYFGAVGTAARSGWEYLPIYIGPALGLIVLFPLWRRIADTARREKTGSLSDFISTRYGKSQALGAVVALVAIVGSLPYIALQLQSLSLAWEQVTAGAALAGSERVTVGVIAVALAGFAILFGARRADLTEHNRGLIHAIALESVVKLAALLAVAGFAVGLLIGSRADPGAMIEGLGPLAAAPVIDNRFLTLTLLAGLAVFCLPRQFHVGFVEAAEPDGARRARWVFPLYLLLTSLAILPLLAAGHMFASAENPDMLVLALPLGQSAHGTGARLITLIAFVGGFSAATAMVIVETVALAAMASNSLVLPLLDRRRTARPQEAARLILPVRRVIIVALLFLAWLYFQAMDRTAGLASIGLISFAALAQMAPALFGAVTWRGGTARGALWGVVSGSAIWAVFLAWPQIGSSFGLADPHPFGLADPLPAGVCLSLIVNTAVFVLVSRASPQRLIERIQARAFVDRAAAPDAESLPPSGVTVGDLEGLVARFIGEAGAARGFRRLARERGLTVRAGDPADAGLARAAERMLAGAIGGSSARRVIATALAGGSGDPEAVARMLDEASEAVQFNRDLLQATLDAIDPGVSVVDDDLRLIAWNRRYIEMFDLPPGYVYVGLPVADVYRLNALRGENPGDAEAWVERRLEALRRRIPHEHERQRPDGRILRSNGAPLSGGGYVTSYTDITELRRAARQLTELNEQLEARVEDRTRLLAEAKQQAEAATASKTRFLAAASHDLLQPLHAARLFIGAMREDGAAAQAEPQVERLAANADRAIESAHGLLNALLDLSRLEAGGVRPAIRPVALAPLFEALRREFAPQAAAKGLKLRFAPTSAWVASDPDLLRSVLQNLVVNAIRYSDRGGVVVGARRAGGAIRLSVVDSGRGMPADRLDTVFDPFIRLPGSEGEPGAGLGLAIVRSIADLLNHPLGLRSELGRGTVFALTLDRAQPPALAPETAPAPRSALAGMRVLCVDNEPAILEAVSALLRRWGVVPVTAPDAARAQALITAGDAIDAAIVDLHLGDGPDGLTVAASLVARGVSPVIMVTADQDETLRERVAAVGARLLPKPVKPAALKALLAGG